MAKARFNLTVQDDDGNVVPNAHVRVMKELAGLPLGAPYSDKLGLTALGNPFDADANGDAGFYIDSGFFRITAYLGTYAAPTFVKTWADVAIGTAAGYAREDLISGIEVVTRGLWAIGTTYAANDLVEYHGYNFISIAGGNVGHAPVYSPAASSAYWTLLGQDIVNLTGLSTSSITIGTGSQTFAIDAGRDWGIGSRLRAISLANPTTHWMQGIVTAIDDSSVTMTVDQVGTGTGTRTDWNIVVAGEQGATGATGDVTPAATAAAAAAAASATAAAASAAQLIGTSTTSLAIAIASKGFTTQSGKFFAAGTRVLATSDADPTNYMFGTVTAYSGTSLTVNVTVIGGSGTKADWTIRVCGEQGAVGPSGSLVFGSISSATPAIDDKTVFGDTSDSDNTKKATYATLLSTLGIMRIVAATSANPTVNDDAGDGFSVGDLWINTTTGIAYRLFDATTTAAVWRAVQPYDAQLSSLIRQNSQSGAYTIVATDSGYDIFHPVGDTNNRTFTIPANSSVAFAIGTVLSFTNMVNTLTIAITTDTLTFLGSGATGSRTLAANGAAVARKVTSTQWVITGVNLS